jgi:hypothetical protein
MLVGKQFLKQIFINTSDLPFMALYPIDLEKTIEIYQNDRYIVKEFTPIIFHSDDGMAEIKIDTINDTFSETNPKIRIIEEMEGTSEFSMEKDEASDVTHLSCIVDKCSSVQDMPSNWIFYGIILLI